MGISIPQPQLHKSQNNKLIPAAQKKAVISAIHVNARQVDVYFVQNPDTIVKGVPVASHIPVVLAIVGMQCKVDLFNEQNPKDMIVTALYGSVPGYSNAFTGSVTVLTSISIDFTGHTFSATEVTLTFVNGVCITSM